jgi:hypothetical protein
MVHHPALQLPPLPGHEMVAVADDVDAPVNHVLFHPGGARRAQFCQVPDGADDAVQDHSIEPVERKAQFFRRLDEQDIVEFVDVVFVQQRRIQDAGLRRPPLRGGRVHAVQVMGQGPSEEGDAAGDHHQHQNQAGTGVMFRAGAGRRREKIMQPAVVRRKSDEPPGERQDAQYHQRSDHDDRRFMDMFFGVVVHAGFAVKSQIGEPEHIKGGQQRADGSHGIEHIMVMSEGVSHDLIFAPKSRKGRNSRNGDRADEEQLVGPGDLMAEAAHLSNVLLPGQGMNDGPRRQEEQGLEKSVRHEMENRGRVSTDAGAEEHIAQLAHRRIGQHPLDVVLHEADCGGKERCGAANHADDGQSDG